MKEIIPKEVKQSINYKIDCALKLKDEDEKIDRLDELMAELHPFLDEIAIRCLTEKIIEDCPDGLKAEYE